MAGLETEGAAVSALIAIRDYVEQANVALEAAMFEADENEAALSQRQMVALHEAQATVYALLMRIGPQTTLPQQPEVHP